MPEMNGFPPGYFCWIENATTDATAAKRFYSGLFGWEAEDNPVGPDMVYTILKRSGRDIGGLYALNAEQKKMNVPPHWLPYVATANVDDAVKRVASLGGTVVMPGMDVMDKGRMAVLQDPTGAHFAVWQSGTHAGAGIAGEHGTMCWQELMTTDTKKATAFYSGLFGWKPEEKRFGDMLYTTFGLGGPMPVAGMMQMGPEFAGAPSHWMTYISVEDCDASAAKAGTLGGQVCVPPTDIPEVGRFAVCNDPAGAYFSIIKLAPMPA
jgi:predicted enzyme related to lactoylglutathione lyase